MWEYNKDITHLYAMSGSKQVWAQFAGISGWKRVATDSADGVTNITAVLSSAKAHGQKVHVYLDSNTIKRAWLA